MVKKKDAYIIKAGNVYGSGRVVQYLNAPAAVVWLFAGKAQYKLSFVPFALQGPDRCTSYKFPCKGLTSRLRLLLRFLLLLRLLLGLFVRFLGFLRLLRFLALLALLWLLLRILVRPVSDPFALAHRRLLA